MFMRKRCFKIAVNPNLKYLPDLQTQYPTPCPGSAFLQYQGTYELRPLQIIPGRFDTLPGSLEYIT